ncbi:MAG: HAD hydrolase-like protein [Candidatus Heimdallarchaeota archaeon]|nr:HAD hydrolase-like protein [Candidatus Heimdallarchaeota archaeon]MCK4770937.1 HAD hydrolase-like protein [Candidatus Heimdallarchaeota archaeon]
MSKTIYSDYSLFFDDGGVMNDNRIRGMQWQKMIGDYFSPKYGGEPFMWAEANFEFINEIVKEYQEIIGVGDLVDYHTYYTDFVKRWITSMFEHVGVKLPANEEHGKIYLEVVEMITPNVRASYPGVTDCIRKLHNQGFKLYTASAEHSIELRGYLRGMRVQDLFEKFYGPDLINIHKLSELFYEGIFNNLRINPKTAIVIDDNPTFLEFALKAGASVIQACLTGEHEPVYQYHVKHMSELPEVVVQLVKKIKK